MLESRYPDRRGLPVFNCLVKAIREDYGAGSFGNAGEKKSGIVAAVAAAYDTNLWSMEEVTKSSEEKRNE